MDTEFPSGRNGKKPVSASMLEAMALRYVERYATSREKLARYLRRKLHEHGWAGPGEPPVDALVERMVELRYVDDRQFAEMRARSLLRRGYGGRRIGRSLAADGITASLREEVAGDVDAMAAALAMARRRRLGPFADGEITPESRRRTIGILMRAGHEFDIARRVANATSVEELENQG